MSVFRAVAWDVDGTLIDSEPLHQRSLIESGAEFGVNLSDLPDEAFRGVHMRDIWTALKPRFPKAVDRKTWIAAIERFYVARAPSLSPIPGALEAVHALAAKGVPQACVSNSGRAIVDANLEALQIRPAISFSISLEDVSAANPIQNPTAKLRAASPSQPRRSSRSRTAARAPVRRERRGSTSPATRPGGTRSSGLIDRS